MKRDQPTAMRLAFMDAVANVAQRTSLTHRINTAIKRGVGLNYPPRWKVIKL